MLKPSTKKVDRMIIHPVLVNLHRLIGGTKYVENFTKSKFDSLIKHQRLNDFGSSHIGIESEGESNFRLRLVCYIYVHSSLGVIVCLM